MVSTTIQADYHCPQKTEVAGEVNLQLLPLTTMQLQRCQNMLSLSQML